MKKNNKIARSFLMISQVGITILVPVFLCVYLGIKLNEWFDTIYFVPVFLFLGMGAAIRNVYQLTKALYADDKKKEDAELAYIENLKKAGERNKQKRERRDGAADEK